MLGALVETGSLVELFPGLSDELLLLEDVSKSRFLSLVVRELLLSNNLPRETL